MTRQYESSSYHRSLISDGWIIDRVCIPTGTMDYGYDVIRYRTPSGDLTYIGYDNGSYDDLTILGELDGVTILRSELGAILEIADDEPRIWGDSDLWLDSIPDVDRHRGAELLR